MAMKIMNCPCGYSLVLFVCSSLFSVFRDFPAGSVVRNPLANVGDAGSVPGSGRSPGVGNGNPFQHSCLDSPLDRGAWQAIVRGVTKESDTI